MITSALADFDLDIMRLRRRIGNLADEKARARLSANLEELAERRQKVISMVSGAETKLQQAKQYVAECEARLREARNAASEINPVPDKVISGMLDVGAIERETFQAVLDELKAIAAGVPTDRPQLRGLSAELSRVCEKLEAI
jgi:chromosome segregation ATPase